MAKQKAYAQTQTPVSMALKLWPSAPITHKADEGIAAILLLADLARRNHVRGFDRAAHQAQAHKGPGSEERQWPHCRNLPSQG